MFSIDRREKPRHGSPDPSASLFDFLGGVPDALHRVAQTKVNHLTRVHTPRKGRCHRKNRTKSGRARQQQTQERDLRRTVTHFEAQLWGGGLQPHRQARRLLSSVQTCARRRLCPRRGRTSASTVEVQFCKAVYASNPDSLTVRTRIRE